MSKSQSYQYLFVGKMHYLHLKLISVKYHKVYA